MHCWCARSRRLRCDLGVGAGRRCHDTLGCRGVRLGCGCDGLGWSRRSSGGAGSGHRCSSAGRCADRCLDWCHCRGERRPWGSGCASTRGCVASGGQVVGTDSLDSVEHRCARRHDCSRCGNRLGSRRGWLVDLGLVDMSLGHSVVVSHRPGAVGDKPVSYEPGTVNHRRGLRCALRCVLRFGHHDVHVGEHLWCTWADRLPGDQLVERHVVGTRFCHQAFLARTVGDCGVLDCTVVGRTLCDRTVLDVAVLCWTFLCWTVLGCTVLGWTVLGAAVLCRTVGVGHSGQDVGEPVGGPAGGWCHTGGLTCGHDGGDAHEHPPRTYAVQVIGRTPSATTRVWTRRPAPSWGGPTRRPGRWRAATRAWCCPRRPGC